MTYYNNTLWGNNYSNYLYGGWGNDVLYGGGGNDRLYGGSDHDTLYGGSGHDKLYGGNGSDKIYGGEGCDTLDGGCGDDQLFGGSGSDVAYGGYGCDYLDGGSGSDWLFGGYHHDVIKGGSGDDKIFGGCGWDKAVFEGTVCEYDFEWKCLYYCGRYRWFMQVTGPDGVDLLNSIEAMQFDDYTIYLDCRNNKVLAKDDTAEVCEKESVILDAEYLTANDFDYDNDALTIVSVTSGTIQAELLADGTVKIDAGSDFDYLKSGETTEATFTYKVKDGKGSYDTATVTVTVVGKGSPPDAQDDIFDIGEGGSLRADILANDSDPDGDPITITDIDGNAADSPFTAISAGGREATVIFNENGTPNFFVITGSNFDDLGEGETDTITLFYTISDGDGGTDTAKITVNIEGENNGPLAGNDAYSIGENENVVSDILANDSDPENDALAITSINGNPADTAFSVRSAGGRDAIVTFSSSGSPNLELLTGGNFDDLSEGEVDTITMSYEISDGNGGTDTAQIVVTILGENDGPNAKDDLVYYFAGTTQAEDILANDTDPEGDDLNLSSLGGNPANTTFSVSTDSMREINLSFSETGTPNVEFTPNASLDELRKGEIDTVSLDYGISDGNGGTDTATLDVVVVGEGPDQVSDIADGITENTEQSFSTTLTTDSTNTDGTVDVSIDISVGDRVQPLVNVVYVVDISGSSGIQFGVDSSGNPITILEAEIEALKELTQKISALGFEDGAVTISVVPFSASSGAANTPISTFTLDSTDDGMQTDITQLEAALNILTPQTSTNYIDAIHKTSQTINDLEAANGEATNLVYFLSDGNPYPTRGQSLAEIEAALIDASDGPSLHENARVSAFGLGYFVDQTYLDVVDNTPDPATGEMSEILLNSSDLTAALLGSPVPEAIVLDADIFVFDENGNQTNAVDLDTSDFVETPLGLSLNVEDVGGLASDLGEMNSLSLVVEIDDNGDGVSDLTLSTEVDIFGYDF